jgi:hypothetical protein
MKQDLTGKAEMIALAHTVKMPVLRPDLEILSQSALSYKGHQARTYLLRKEIKFPMEYWWPIIVISRKESPRSQKASYLGQGRSWFHPVERLGTRNDISTPIRQARLMSNSLSIFDMCRAGMFLSFTYSLSTHPSIGFDPNHPLGSLTPDHR